MTRRQIFNVAIYVILLIVLILALYFGYKLNLFAAVTASLLVTCIILWLISDDLGIKTREGMTYIKIVGFITLVTGFFVVTYVIWTALRDFRPGYCIVKKCDL